MAFDPGNPALEFKLSLIQVSLGVAYEALSRPEEHRQAYRDALAIREHLHEIDPDNAEWTRDLAWTYFWVGGDFLDNGDAGRGFEKLPAMPVAAPNVSEFRYRQSCRQICDLAWAHHAIGLVYKAQGKLKEAEGKFAEAFNLRKELVAADPGNAKWRKDLALSFETIGDIADAKKDATAALDNFRSAIGIFEDLICKAPTNRSWRDSLSNIYNKMANIQKCRGDLGGALAGYGQALEIRAALLIESPDNITAMIRAATSEKSRRRNSSDAGGER